MSETLADFFEEINEYIMEQRAEGKKIIAYLAHEFVPPELISAAGAIPLPLIFAGNEELMTLGADVLNPTICTYARSLIGMFQQRNENRRYKFLNNVDAIIVTDYCTANLLVAHTIAKEFNIKYVEFLIPYFQEQVHVNFFEEQIKKLSDWLMEFTGNEISPSILFQNITKYHSMREKLSQLYLYDVKGSEQLQIIQKASLYGPDSKITNDLINMAMKRSKRNENLPKRMILSGCASFIGDDLFQLIEECGGNIVYNDTWMGNLIIDANGKDIPQNSPDINTYYVYLAEIYGKNKSSAHISPNYIENYEFRIEKISKDTQTNAVLYHIIKFCDTIGFQRQDLKDTMTAKNFYWLNLERDYSAEMKGQLRTRIEAFLEMIE